MTGSRRPLQPISCWRNSLFSVRLHAGLGRLTLGIGWAGLRHILASLPPFAAGQVCYATSVILALAPLLQAGWIDPSAGIIADSKSGASGAGRTPSDKLHFAEVNENLRAYGLFSHRHVPEMLQALDLRESQFVFTPHLLPITRGILSTIYVRLAASGAPKRLEQIFELFEGFYTRSPMVRIYPPGELPEISAVAHTNFADLGFALDEPTGRLIIVSALDNLGKGAAGQAVQNMNLMFGFAEDLGLA